ncbi:hypothetical protein LUZ61_020283 [Rhynchospora tenuis]|uniref:KIB1-4 beta-propeller domain-containing protein n=1 Tax=Rhynchospora tenuis TaxID=198213 RepID=A0AAD5ZCS2_9POAL|nr:hypothetical protein LUZ61_020283 [Rhynchospora tenuis]
MWRYSGQNWTKIFEFLHGFKDGNEMISYFNGKLYIVDMRTRKTEVIDVATGEVESRIAHPSVMFEYLINACGDLLGVQLCEPDDIEYKFEIYRLEATESPRWAKLNGGIGNRVLFLDNIIETGFCLNASEFDGFRGNCIYLRQDHPTRHKGYRVFIARYDLEEHKSEVLPLPHSTGTWFVPTLC